jgi:hypothetical protein
MSNREPLTEAPVEFDGDESLNPVYAVADDFAALVVILERQLEMVPTSDEETRLHIGQAKAAAERGAQLSRSLLKRIEPLG